eukprot:scaffold157966_cov20-Tisochrysis_lutea.AAC.2
MDTHTRLCATSRSLSARRQQKPVSYRDDAYDKLMKQAIRAMHWGALGAKLGSMNKVYGHCIALKMEFVSYCVQPGEALRKKESCKAHHVCGVKVPTRVRVNDHANRAGEGKEELMEKAICVQPSAQKGTLV